MWASDGRATVLDRFSLPAKYSQDATDTMQVKADVNPVSGKVVNIIK